MRKMVVSILALFAFGFLVNGAWATVNISGTHSRGKSETRALRQAERLLMKVAGFMHAKKGTIWSNAVTREGASETVRAAVILRLMTF